MSDAKGYVAESEVRKISSETNKQTKNSEPRCRTAFQHLYSDDVDVNTAINNAILTL